MAPAAIYQLVRRPKVQGEGHGEAFERSDGPFSVPIRADETRWDVVVLITDNVEDDKIWRIAGWDQDLQCGSQVLGPAALQTVVGGKFPFLSQEQGPESSIGPDTELLLPRQHTMVGWVYYGGMGI